MDIASVRHEMKLTQAELAVRLGVSHAYIGHLENGRRKPSLKLAAKLEAISGRSDIVSAVVAEKTGADA